MKPFLFVLIIITFLFASCTKSPDLNLITKHSIGLLTDSTQIKDLEVIFPNDSITRYIGGDEFTGSINNIEIFETDGTKILALTPKQSLDSTSTIKAIEIFTERYKTSKGLHKNSTFKEIKDNYEISNIQNSIRNIIITVDEINSFFTIDKNELPAELRFDMNLKIEAIQIPDEAKIKGFFMQWY